MPRTEHLIVAAGAGMVVLLLLEPLKQYGARLRL